MNVGLLIFGRDAMLNLQCYDLDINFVDWWLQPYHGLQG